MTSIIVPTPTWKYTCNSLPGFTLQQELMRVRLCRNIWLVSPATVFSFHHYPRRDLLAHYLEQKKLTSQLILIVALSENMIRWKQKAHDYSHKFILNTWFFVCFSKFHNFQGVNHNMFRTAWGQMMFWISCYCFSKDWMEFALQNSMGLNNILNFVYLVSELEQFHFLASGFISSILISLFHFVIFGG